MFFDSHLHFDDADERGDLDAMVSRARDAGVHRMLAIGGREAANSRALRVARRFPGQIWAAVGLDRDQADGWDGARSGLRVCAREKEVVAIGETGLDYHYSADTADAQRRLFSGMLDLALEVGKPVVVHSREADEDTLTLLRPYATAWSGTGAPGVLHCFTGGLAFALQLLELGFLISFSGILSFKSATELREVAAFVPEDRLLIETDSPYLAPVPHRGKANEPMYLPQVAECLARVRGCSVEEIARITTQNTNVWLGLEA